MGSRDENSMRKLEELDIDGEDITDIDRAKLTRLLPYPAISVSKDKIYFNAYCTGLFKSSRMHVSKTAGLLIFSDGKSNSDFKISRTASVGGMAISAKTIMKLTCISSGSYYRLYRVKNGGYAIKLHEPLNIKEEAYVV